MAGAAQMTSMTSVDESAHRTPGALDAYFRSSLDVELAAGIDLSAQPGFFMFSGAMCFGRVAGAVPAAEVSSSLPDVTGLAQVTPGRVTLPFDLDEIVTNLREERYQAAAAGRASRLTETGLARRAYYFLRPILPVSVRKHLQRIHLRGFERIPFPAWPVDSTVDSLMSSAVTLGMQASGVREIPFIWFWPEGATAAAIVTHDVESRAGLDFCERLMDIDEAAGVRSSFQLVPELRYDTSGTVVSRLRARGFEVNIHDLNHDGRLFHNRNQFTERAARINRYAREFESRGFRAACMYREQAWLVLLDVAYDMSVPNVAHLEPQRGGCCTVMPYFVGNLLELPLTTVQDYSLFHILGDYSIDLWKRQLEAILGRHGLITILAHPDYLIEKKAQRIYRELLAHLRGVCDGQNVWHALPGDVERWWRERAAMKLVRRGDSWAIEGEGCGRARVAYAISENGRMRFSLQSALESVA